MSHTGVFDARSRPIVTAATATAGSHGPTLPHRPGPRAGSAAATGRWDRSVAFTMGRYPRRLRAGPWPGSDLGDRPRVHLLDLVLEVALHALALDLQRGGQLPVLDRQVARQDGELLDRL